MIRYIKEYSCDGILEDDIWKIEQSFTEILNKDGKEWTISKSFSSEADEYDEAVSMGFDKFDKYIKENSEDDTLIGIVTKESN